MTSDFSSYQNIRSTSSEPSIAGNGSRQRVIIACLRCRSRKIRCPGGETCAKCLTANVDCVYVPVPIQDNIAVREKKALAKAHRPMGPKPERPRPAAPRTSSKRKLAKSEKVDSGKKRQKKEESDGSKSPSAEPGFEISVPHWQEDYSNAMLSEDRLHEADNTYDFSFAAHGDIAASLEGDYLAAHDSSTGRLDPVQGYTMSLESTSFPPTPISGNFPFREGSENPMLSPATPQLQQGESYFRAKDYNHTVAVPVTPSLPTSHAVPLFPPQARTQPYSTPTTPTQPSGLCIYITGNHHVQHDGQPQYAYQMPKPDFPLPPTPPPEMASYHFPEIQQRPVQLFPARPKLTHSRTISLPTNHQQYLPVYRGPIDWTRRPLGPLLARRPSMDRSYSDCGTLSSVTTTQTVRLDQVYRTTGGHQIY